MGTVARVDETVNKHLMLDLETLGTACSDTCPIIQVGAVVFTWEKDVADYLANTTFLVTDKVEPQTMQWWAQTSPAQLAEILAHPNRSLDFALSEVVGLARMHKVQTLWARGHFDAPIFRAKLRACGKTGFPVEFRADRDVRTLEDLYTGITGKRALRRPDTDSEHNALADAKWQAHCVRTYCQELGYTL